MCSVSRLELGRYVEQSICAKALSLSHMLWNFQISKTKAYLRTKTNYVKKRESLINTNYTNMACTLNNFDC